MYRIFVVEDDEIIARSVKRHLERWDYEVAGCQRRAKSVYLDR